MKRIASSLAVLLLFGVVAAPGIGSAQEEWRLTSAGWVMGDVEHVRTVPFEAGSAVGGTVHDGHLYVTTWRSFSIYDISDPVEPELLSITPLGVQVINEGPSTNGEILLLADDNDGILGILQVWDVRDKTEPVLISELPYENPDHIWTCVLDCAFAYGSGGTIVDLADSADPAIVGNWREIAPFRASHGIAETEPGVVFVGTLPQYVLDARGDPANPAVLAEIEPPTTPFPMGESLASYLQWPRGRFALTTLETPFSGPCSEDSGGFVSYDTSGFEETGTFDVADVFRITELGLPADGNAPANAVGCSPLALDAHPDFKKSRTVAVGWFENGVRVFTVGKRDGAISESAGFIAHGTEAATPVWGSEEILYVVDTTRGLDVFRVGVPERSTD